MHRFDVGIVQGIVAGKPSGFWQVSRWPQAEGVFKSVTASYFSLVRVYGPEFIVRDA